MADSVVSQTGAAIDDAAVSRFHGTLRGELLRPGDGRYEEARRIWNALIDKRPGLIVRCADADDVAHGVRFAREHEVEVSVRGGGHNIAGRCVCDGGLMLDLSQMKQIDVDPEGHMARAQPGLTLGEFDRATQAHGLATTMGIASTTGIAGLTLGGGYGWLAGRFGLTCDNLASIELVTADCDLVTASVVTSFEYRLYPLDKVLGGMALYAPTKESLRYFDEFSHACPDEVCTLGLLTSAPDGSPTFAIVACHCGPIDAGERALAPLRRFGPPLADMIEPRDYVEMQRLTDGAWPPGRLYYWKSSLVSSLSDEAIEVLLDYGASKPTRLSAIGLQQLHGAASRTDADGAFPHRFEHYNCIPLFEAEDPADVEGGTDWARRCWQAMQPFAAGAAYVNDLGDEGEERVREAYGPSLQRLRVLKSRYDPTNFFHLNQNIAPAAT
jgi:FAD/FMN-containing dehydrogenase